MTDEAKRIGDQIPIYQRVTGGWPQFWPKIQEVEKNRATGATEDCNYLIIS